MLPLHLNELILLTRIVSHNTNNVIDNCASLSCSVLIIAVKDPVLTGNRIINLLFRRRAQSQQSSLLRLRRQCNQIKSIFRPTNVYCDRFSFTQLLKTIYYSWLDNILRLDGLLCRCSNYLIISDLHKVILIVMLLLIVTVIRNSNTMPCLTPERL